MTNLINNQLKNLNQLSLPSKYKFLFPPITSAILCFTSYPPFPAWAIFFCFAPVFNQWFLQTHLKKVLLSSFICQFLITLGGFYWVAHTAWEFGHIPVPLNLVVLVLFCCIANLHIVLAAISAHIIKTKLNLRPGFYFITIATFYGFFEFSFPQIFPWNLGYPLLFSQLKTAQVAEYVGFNLLSLFVLFMNALFALSYFLFPQKKWSRALYAFLILFSLTELLGLKIVSKLPVEDNSVNVLMVQTNMGSFEKYWHLYGQNYQKPIIEKLYSLTEGAIKNKNVDLVIWPENAFPDNLDTHFLQNPIQQNLINFISRNKINLITGAFSQSLPQASGATDYSGMFLFDQSGSLLGSYRKTILLAFGEYIPGSQYLPFLKKLIPEISELGRGLGPSILTLKGINFTPIICYEAIYPSFVAGSVKLNNHIIVNTTNDSWYGDFSEQKQHLTMSVARSIELRKPQIRATNTGISVLVNARGEILTQTKVNTEWAEIKPLPYYSTPQVTFFSKIYNKVIYIFSALVLFVILIDIIFHVKKRT